MKVWFHINGERQGPYSIEEIPAGLVTPETPVWYEGLDYWIVARESPYLSHLWQTTPPPPPSPNNPPVPPVPPAPEAGQSDFEVSMEDAQAPDSEPQTMPQPQPQPMPQPQPQPMPQPMPQPQPGFYQPGPQPGQPMYQQQGQQPKCPPSYFVLAILVTVLCCNPVGIAAVYCAGQVRSRYYNFDYEGAKKASEAAAMWIIVAFVTTLVFWPAWALISLL